MSDPGTPRCDRDLYENGYPTLVVRMIPGVYNYENVPEKLRENEELIEYATHRSAASGFSTCMVFGPRDAWYCHPDGTHSHSEEPPSGGVTLKNGKFVGIE